MYSTEWSTPPYTVHFTVHKSGVLQKRSHQPLMSSVPYMSLEHLQRRSFQSEVFRVPYTFLEALGSVNK